MRQQSVRVAAIVAFASVALVSAGCLVKDTNETIVLEPDGSARWTVMDANIHATGDTPAARESEEQEFMALVAAGKDPNATAFRAIGALDVRTDVVSARWPFAVVTQARLPDIARAFQGLLDQIPEMHGRSVLERNGDRTTWTITLEYDADASEGTQPPGDDEAAAGWASLLDDKQPTFCMQHGQFVDAAGFEITDDGRVAKLGNLDDHDWEKQPKVVLSLTWVAAEAVNRVQK